MTSFCFRLVQKDKNCQARLGEIKTPHGFIKTPVFMPVGTQAAVKTLSPSDLKEIGVEIILGNTYHLYLRPGISVIKQFGGLHQFMAWNGPLLTDSGGYQVFSLAKLRKITDHGVEFRSHLDGSPHYFTPPLVIGFQKVLGADIIMAFDECTPYPASKAYSKEAMIRTHRWAQESQKAFLKDQTNQVLFGITQGGMYSDLRKESAQFLRDLDFPGYGIGGLSVGEPRNLTWKMLEIQLAILPFCKPRYLMGVGEPTDLLEAIERGCDMFDSALPTRLARNGTVFTYQGKLNLKLAKWKSDGRPIEENCECYTCRNFSRAYLRHLILSNEILGHRLTTYHNLSFLIHLIKKARQAIKKSQFLKFKKEFLENYSQK